MKKNLLKQVLSTALCFMMLLGYVPQMPVITAMAETSGEATKLQSEISYTGGEYGSIFNYTGAVQAAEIDPSAVSIVDTNGNKLIESPVLTTDFTIVYKMDGVEKEPILPGTYRVYLRAFATDSWTESEVEIGYLTISPYEPTIIFTPIEFEYTQGTDSITASGTIELEVVGAEGGLVPEGTITVKDAEATEITIASGTQLENGKATITFSNIEPENLFNFSFSYKPASEAPYTDASGNYETRYVTIAGNGSMNYTVNGVTKTQLYFAPGQEITVNAGTMEGFDFGGWSISSSISVVPEEELLCSSITFTMPEDSSLALTASWKAHEWSTEWHSDVTHHWQECLNGDSCTITENSQKCGYGEHQGGMATCVEKAVCNICGVSYGDYGRHTIDADSGSCMTCEALTVSPRIVSIEYTGADGENQTVSGTGTIEVKISGENKNDLAGTQWQIRNSYAEEGDEPLAEFSISNDTTTVSFRFFDLPYYQINSLKMIQVDGGESWVVLPEMRSVTFREVPDGCLVNGVAIYDSMGYFFPAGTVVTVNPGDNVSIQWECYVNPEEDFIEPELSDDCEWTDSAIEFIMPEGYVDLTAVIGEHEHIDLEADGYCDICSEYMPELCADEDGDHYCDICYKHMPELCTDENADHCCDICDEPMPELCTDEDTDHTCDICDEWLSDYCYVRDEDGNYINDTDGNHHCDVCAGYLPRLWVDEVRDHICDICGTASGNGCYDDGDGNGVCDWCGKIMVNGAEITLDSDTFTWEGEAIEPAVTVTYGGTTLTEGTDYTIEYIANDYVPANGIATVTVRGKGDYGGIQWIPFTITKGTFTPSVTSYEITLPGDVTESSFDLWEVVELPEDDYGTLYELGESTSTGTGTGIGSFGLDEYGDPTGELMIELENCTPGDVISFPLTVSTGNYKEYNFTIKVTVSSLLNRTLSWNEDLVYADISYGGEVIDLSDYIIIDESQGTSLADIIYTVSSADDRFDPGTATINGSMLTPGTPGDVRITASIPGNDTYAEASAICTLYIGQAVPDGEISFEVLTESTTLDKVTYTIDLIGLDGQEINGTFCWLEAYNRKTGETTLNFGHWEGDEWIYDVELSDIAVEQSVEFRWKFYPEDENYIEMRGPVVLFPEHYWTFTAEGSTLTLACSLHEDCTPIVMTLQKNPNDSYVYNISEWHGVDLIVSDPNWEPAQGAVPDYEKWNSDTNSWESLGAVKDAGKYRALFSLDGEERAILEFEVAPHPLTEGMFNVSYGEDADAFYYNGEEQLPTLNCAGVTLIEGSDYTVTWPEDTSSAGDKIFTLTGVGNYTGTVGLSYLIKPKKISVTGATVAEAAYQPIISDYNFTVLDVIFDGLVDGESLTQGTDYTVSADLLGENKVGDVAVKVWVTMLTGNYSLELENDSYETTVKINKAAEAPDMPSRNMNVSFETEWVSDIFLPNNWIWEDADTTKTLIAGEAVTATAVYIGADAGNYEVTSVEIVITRSINYYYTITISSNPAAGGTASSSALKAPEGTRVILTATPSEGYEFTGWNSSDVTVSDNTFIMPAKDVTVTAMFTKKEAPTPEPTPEPTKKPSRPGGYHPSVWVTPEPTKAPKPTATPVPTVVPTVVPAETPSYNPETSWVVPEIQEMWEEQKTQYEVLLGTSKKDTSMVETLEVGKTMDLNFYGVKNWKKEDYEYMWTSSDESVAIVDSVGVVTMLSEGVAIIRLDMTYKATGEKLNVAPMLVGVPEAVYDVFLGTSKRNVPLLRELFLEEEVDINFYGVKNWKKEDYTYEWSSSDEEVATVNELGYVIAKSTGLTVIRLRLMKKATGEYLSVAPVVIYVKEKEK